MPMGSKEINAVTNFFDALGVVEGLFTVLFLCILYALYTQLKKADYSHDEKDAKIEALEEVNKDLMLKLADCARDRIELEKSYDNLQSRYRQQQQMTDELTRHLIRKDENSSR